MCDPVTLAVMAGGAGISAFADSKAASAQSDAVGAAQRRRTERQGQVSEAINNLLEQYAPDKRAETQQAGADQVQGSIDKAVDASNEATPAGAEFQGKTSEDFLKTAAERKSTDLDRSTRIARLLGQIGGAGRGRQTENNRIGDTSSDISQIANFAQGDTYTDSLRIQEAGRPNPFLKLLGGAMQGAGTAMGAASGVAGAASAGGAAGAAIPGVAGPVASKKLPVMTVRALT